MTGNEVSGPFESSGSGLQESDWLELEDVVQPYSGIVANYGGELAVSQHTPLAAMSVNVAIGGAVVKSSRYRNKVVTTVTIDAADSTMDRYDLIVVRRTLNPPSSTIIVTVHKGTNYTAGTAVAPSPTRTSTVYELILATVFIAHGTTAITTAMITDDRLSANCGYYSPVVGGMTVDPATGDFDFDGKRLTDIADPVEDTDADTPAARDAAIAAAIGESYGPGRLLAVTKLTPGSGNHTLNTKTAFVRLRMKGGCGGGGGCGESPFGGGGGGAGGYAEWVRIPVTGGAVLPYVVGIAGPGGAAHYDGTDGGDTTITINSITYTALKGLHGTKGTSGGNGLGGQGGAQTNGDIVQVGRDGTSSVNNSWGVGGQGWNGDGGRGGTTNPEYGYAGYDGAPGMIVIEEYS